MGLLDLDYDPWTGKKIKRKKNNSMGGGILGGIKPINVPNIWGGDMPLGSSKIKSKRVKLTPTQRLYIWEHPNMYGRKCNICGQKIDKQSDLELDHTHPHSKGGKKMALAHKECNRMKGSKSLKYIQKKMAFK
jgi:hypothetical protein